jgi:multidrug efflux pump subunit AcrA (membrane-fusion protein)
MIKPLFAIVLAVVALCPCTGPNEKKETTEKIALHANKNSVEVCILSKATFPKQLISKGKINALRKSELKYRLSGEIAQVLVKSGEHVAT